jgi:hypothetical protein
MSVADPMFDENFDGGPPESRDLIVTEHMFDMQPIRAAHSGIRTPEIIDFERNPG